MFQWALTKCAASMKKYTVALLLPARTPADELIALDAALACITNLASDVQLDGIQEYLTPEQPPPPVAAEPEDEQTAAGEEAPAADGSAVEAEGEDGCMERSAAVLLAASATNTTLGQVVAASTAASIASGPALRRTAAATAARPEVQSKMATAAAVATALRDVDLLENVDADVARVRDAAAEVSGVAARIAKGGELVADVVVKSKDFAAQGMHLVGSLVKTRVPPPPPGRRPVEVGPTTKQAIRSTQRLTEIAVEGSKLALSTAAYTFKFVGTSVSASVQETRLYHSLVALAHRRAQARAAAAAAASAAAAAAAALDPVGGVDSPTGRLTVGSTAAQRMMASIQQAIAPPTLSPEDVHKAKMVMGTVLTSCLGVYRTCKAALWEFTDDLRDLTTDLTEHYYGTDVSDAAGAAFDSVRNVGTVLLNVDSMPSGPSNVAFNVAKESGLDILALDEWLAGSVAAHGYVEAFSPIATWMPQWMLLRSSALLVYNVRTAKATRPVEVITIADITGAWPVSAPSQAEEQAAVARSDGGAGAGDSAPASTTTFFHFEVSTQELSYRLRVRNAAVRQQWLDAIMAAVSGRKALAPKVVLSAKAQSFVSAEQEQLEAWHQAVAARMAAWEQKLGLKAAQAAEAADSWATLQAWATAEAAQRANEAAAEVTAFVRVIPESVASTLPTDVSLQLTKAREWAHAHLLTSGASSTGEVSESSSVNTGALLAVAEAQMRKWLADNPRLCTPDDAFSALGSAAGNVVASAEAAVGEAMHVLERPPPLLSAEVLSTAAAWAESAEAVFSPGTAYAQRRQSVSARAAPETEAPENEQATMSAPAVA
jgi:Senescence-associated protein